MSNPLGTSWKTNLGGICGALALACKAHPKTAEYSEFFAEFGLALVGFSARDHNVTSEQANGQPPVISAAKNLFLVFAASVFFLTGCATTPVGRAEQSMKIADATFDTYVHVESANSELLKKADPKFKQVADKIRQYWPTWAAKLDAAILSYKHSHSDQNQKQLSTSIAEVEAQTSEVAKTLTEANTKLGK